MRIVLLSRKDLRNQAFRERVCQANENLILIEMTSLCPSPNSLLITPWAIVCYPSWMDHSGTIKYKCYQRWEIYYISYHDRHLLLQSHAIRLKEQKDHKSRSYDSYIFNDLIHKVNTWYVDDMVVTSKTQYNHLEDMRTILIRLRKYNMKMNALKCALGVSLGKFLGFLVCHRRNRIDPCQIEATQEMSPPQNL